MMNYFKNLKNNYIYKVIVLLLVGMFSYYITIWYGNGIFLFKRCLLILVVSLFCSLNLLIDIKKLWANIYKYRYLIGILLLTFLVAGGYHGNSIGIYDKIVEPSSTLPEYQPILGINREIRSDEWIAYSPAYLSQNSLVNNYKVENNSIMATSGLNVSFYPKLATNFFYNLSSPKLLFYNILPLEQAYSFHWYFEIFALFFASFEFFMIISKKKKIWSLVGSIMVTFAPATQWWESAYIVTILYSGLGAIDFFYYFLISKNKYLKILLSILIGWMGAIFIQVLYPAWMVPFGYIYLVIIIWIMMDNKEQFNLKWFILLLIIVLSIIGLLIIPQMLNSLQNIEVTLNTVYPGARASIGGSGWQKLFDYFSNLFLPYFNFGNPCEASQFIGLYPLPLILSTALIIRDRKKSKDLLLILITIVVIFLSIWNYIKLPEIISKISFLSLSTEFRTTIAVNFGCLVLLIYILSNYDLFKKDNKVILFAFATIFSLYGYEIVKKTYPILENNKIEILTILIYTLIIYMIFVSKKNSIVLPIFLILISLVSGAVINPINSGLQVIYDKPVSQEIQKIISENPEASWVSANSHIAFQSFILANGARVINSVNFLPNFELWDILDKERNYEEIWNRYAHLVVSIKNYDNTSITLTQNDVVSINLANDDICKLGIKYIFTSDQNIEDYSSKNLQFNKIYGNENAFIYKAICSE